MGTPPQAVVRAAQPCSPSSSLVPSPQHRRTTSGLAEHPAALLPLLQTSPSPSGSSPRDQPPRRTVMLRERRCWLGTSKGVSYNSKSCSDGCCFYTPASSKRVQEIEAEVEKNLPTWFRTPAGGCD